MKLKKIILQYFIAFVVLTGSFSWMYNTYFSTEHNIISAGPQENYAWAIAKFAIRLSEYEALTEHQLRVKSLDNSDMKRELDFLFSSSNVLLTKSDSTRYLYKEEGYAETISSIHHLLEEIDQDMNSNAPDYEHIIRILNVIRLKNKNLIAIADHAEVNQRTIMFDDYIQKWESFKIPMFVIYSLLVMMLFISFRQLTSLSNLLESEKKAFNNKNAFLGKLGHELRTTLQAIVGSIEVILYSPEKSVNKDVLHRLENSASQIERQMNDLAEFAKIDNGAIKINISDINLSDLVSKVINDCNTKFSSKKLQIVIQHLPSEMIKSDAIRLIQILENLLTNAFKYTEEGTVNVHIHIKKHHHTQVLILEISDTGIGIDKEKQKIIFQPFVRIENGSSIIPGSGMGLAIVEGIVKAMNGKISVSSEPNKGSTFTVQIPVELSELDTQPDHSTQNTFTYKLKGLSILHIDDSELTCESMSLTLNSVGYKSESISSVSRAIEKMMRIPYDIILSDLQMPVMTGDELVDYIRSHEGPNRNTPFIFISAYPESYKHTEIPLIVKPAKVADINREISKVLQ